MQSIVRKMRWTVGLLKLAPLLHGRTKVGLHVHNDTLPHTQERHRTEARA
jgi:hypothetical protein